MGIVFHLSRLSTQYKWKKLTTAWIICCLLFTSRRRNGWSVKILRWWEWSNGSKAGKQNILVFCDSGTTLCQTRVVVKTRVKTWLAWRPVSPFCWIEQNTASALTYQVKSNEELYEGNGQRRQQVCFPTEEVHTDKNSRLVYLTAIK